MKDAGCYRIHFGVETGSKRILDATGKATTLEEAEYAIGLAKTSGFDTMAYYMFGFPGETREDAKKTIDFAMKLDTNYAVFAVTIPYPGTALYDLGLEQKILPFDFWEKYTKNPEPDFRIPFLIEEHMDRKTLISIKNQALRKYYFRPQKIFNEIKNLTSFKEFGRKGGMAFNIISDSIKSVWVNDQAKTNGKNYNMYHKINNVH